MTKKFINIEESSRLDISDICGTVEEIAEVFRKEAERISREADIDSADIKFEVEQYYEDVDVTYSYDRLETDKEYEKRLEKERKAAEKEKKRKATLAKKAAERIAKDEEAERKLYESLKEKYESFEHYN